MNKKVDILYNYIFFAILLLFFFFFPVHEYHYHKVSPVNITLGFFVHIYMISKNGTSDLPIKV